MRWQLGRRSTNVIDRRAEGPARGRGLGGVAGLGGCGTVVVLGIAVLVWALGGDPGQILGGGQPPSGGPVQPASPVENQQADFVSAVLASTEDTWGEIFAEHGATYQPPRLVLFRDGVDSA